MAGDVPPVRHRTQRRCLGTAARDGDRAARVEGAARRHVDRIGRIAFQDQPLLRRPGRRDRRNQRARVGVRRRREQPVGIATLDDAAEIHHRHFVAHLADHAQIVADEEIGEAHLRLQVEQEIDDLRLDRHVERRDRLVADQEPRLGRQRAGQHDPLALAARELMRIAVEVVRLQADRPQDRQRLVAPLGRRADGWITSGSMTCLPTAIRRSSAANGSW